MFLLQIVTLQKYCKNTAQVSEEEVDSLIKKTIEEAGAVSVKDMGKVMKILMPKLTGVADGKIVGEKVKAFLSK